MRRLLMAFACLSTSVAAQDFSLRAENGERSMATQAGAAYLDRIAPALEQSLRTCTEEGAAIRPGDTITLVAWVSREGVWSQVQPALESSASRCLIQRLQATTLPPPTQWHWEQGEFPLTLSFGVGRGTVNGIRQGD